jgi:hypothetical protein
MPETRNDTGGPLGNGFKFNSTGSDDTSTEILTAQIPARDRARRTLLIAVIVVGMIAALGISFVRSGLNPFKDDRKNHGGFEASDDHNVEQSLKSDKSDSDR